jgi:FtsZ-binding cell division protein ZapB
MSHAEEIDRLEQFVEKLLDSYQALKLEHENVLAARQQLEHDYNALQQQMETGESELRQQLEQLHNDRAAMHSRVSGLISKIEEWERGMTAQQAPAESAPEKAHEDFSEEEQQANMFNAMPEQQ